MRVLIEPENTDSGQMVASGGEVCRIGRSEGADFVFPEDTFLSGLHFAIEVGDSSCHVRDLSSRNGTFLNGTRIVEAVLGDGDWISAGHKNFHIRIERNAPSNASLPALPLSELKVPQARMSKILAEASDPLFALMDPARDDRVLDLLRTSKEKYQSLYEGVQGKELDNWAPHLVKIGRNSCLLPWLLHEGWGKSWGVYFTSNRDFALIRKHFRQFLMIQTQNGQELYFRFYDPRVLRRFVPTCMPADLASFGRPVLRFILEGQTPSELLQFIFNGDVMTQTITSIVDYT